jgi:Domain of unknown function (DUF4157)
MSYDRDGKGRETQEATRQDDASRSRVPPGKKTLTQGIRRDGPVQREASPAPPAASETTTDLASPRKSSAELTGDVWMDAAHRGTTAMTERGLDPVQARGRIAAEDPSAVHAAADAGVQGSGRALPYFDRIQAAFGAEHDLGGVKAHVGGAAADASERIGAEAYATGEHVAFRGAPDLHTSAHEAAHVVQQRAGVALTGGVGRVGDAYEQHADAVADRVVRGESAADLLDSAASSGAGARPAGPGVQRRSPPGTHAADDKAQDIANDHAADDIEAILDRPDPVAGVGDPTGSLQALDALPLSSLLATLDELDARGRLSEIRQALEHAPVRAERVRTALLVRDMARLPSVRAEAAPPGRAGHGLGEATARRASGSIPLHGPPARVVALGAHDDRKLPRHRERRCSGDETAARPG